MKGPIRYEGRVEEIDGNHVSVTILQNSSCDTCGASGSCRAAGLRERRVDVDAPDVVASLRTGDRVFVTADGCMGRRAVWLAFGVPLLLLAAGVCLNTTGLSEGLSLLVALVLLVIYYVVLAQMRGMKRAFRFHIEPMKTP